MEAVFNFLTGPSLIISFVAFMLVSYIFLGLLTWSFVKPIKYMSVPIIITGIITLSLKGVVYLIVNYIAKDDLELFKPFFDDCGNLFANIGLIFLVSGVILFILYKVTNYFIQKKDKDIPKQEENLS